MSSEVVLKVENVGKRYEIYEAPHHRLLQTLLRGRKQFYKEFWALKDISFEVKKGECLGIIGRNGSGKSTLLQIIAGTLAPTTGSVSVNGKVAALLELGSGFNPEFTGRENVYMNGAIMGLSKAEMDKKFDEIAAFADIGEFIEQPVKIYSSGMMVRLAFAVQACIDATIVIIDEALAVGDVFFRQKCYTRLEQLKKSGAAILLVSHSMPDIEQHCERAILVDHGAPVFSGSSSETTKHYYLLHQSQTRGQIDEIPSLASGNEHRENTFSGNRPPSEAFLDIAGKRQVSNGQARCVGVALCDEYGRPCGNFCQGDRAVFFSEYELIDGVDVPVCGIVIRNDRGVIVHGKNAWQYDDDVPLGLCAGSRVVCRQEVVLKLGLGEYSFEIGMAAISRPEWEKRRLMSHESWQVSYRMVCVVPDAGQFSVGYAMNNGIAVLTHHGVADLPGTISTKGIQ